MNYLEMLRQKFCPICNSEKAQCETAPDRSLAADVDCPRCGKFRISKQATEALPVGDRHLLSSVCRTWSGGNPPYITTETIAGLLAKAPRLGVTERLDLLLTLIADTSDQIGHWSKFDRHNDFPLLAMKNEQEVSFLIREMGSRGYLSEDQGNICLTVKGWERLEELKRAGRESSLAFVAMWFHESVHALYEDAIEPAVRAAGYQPLRIDRHDHLNRIDDEIIGQIRRSRFMVADFTGQRGGVYFEAGFMRGLGRNVIWMCRKDELDKIHFDVRQYKFIDWSTPDDARTRLQHSILANEGEGPLLPSDAKKTDRSA